jgi:hypothetical protein
MLAKACRDHGKLENALECPGFGRRYPQNMDEALL